jgi:hypothetical protein
VHDPWTESFIRITRNQLMRSTSAFYIRLDVGSVINHSWWPVMMGCSPSDDLHSSLWKEDYVLPFNTLNLFFVKIQYSKPCTLFVDSLEEFKRAFSQHWKKMIGWKTLMIILLWWSDITSRFKFVQCLNCYLYSICFSFTQNFVDILSSLYFLHLRLILDATHMCCR